MDTSDRELLQSVCHTALCTKIKSQMSTKLAEICVDAVKCIQEEGKPIDLHMVEIMHMQHRMDTDTRFVNGLVLDHGSRHPDMPTDLKNCFIFFSNVNLEYEKRSDTPSVSCTRENKQTHTHKHARPKGQSALASHPLFCCSIYQKKHA